MSCTDIAVGYGYESEHKKLKAGFQVGEVRDNRNASTARAPYVSASSLELAIKSLLEPSETNCKRGLLHENDH